MGRLWCNGQYVGLLPLRRGRVPTYPGFIKSDPVHNTLAKQRAIYLSSETSVPIHFEEALKFRTHKIFHSISFTIILFLSLCVVHCRDVLRLQRSHTCAYTCMCVCSHSMKVVYVKLSSALRRSTYEVEIFFLIQNQLSLSRNDT